jgi:hypothetical protein
MWISVVEFFGTVVSLLIALEGFRSPPRWTFGLVLLGLAGALTILFVIDQLRFVRVPRRKRLKSKAFYRYMAKLIERSGTSSVTIVSGSLSWARADARVLKALKAKGARLTVYMQ